MYGPDITFTGVPRCDLADPASYDWPSLLEGASWLHVSGVTPALGERTAQATIDAVSGATPRSGPQTLAWDLTDASGNAVPPATTCAPG